MRCVVCDLQPRKMMKERVNPCMRAKKHQLAPVRRWDVPISGITAVAINS
jgi:hypothetical protein